MKSPLNGSYASNNRQAPIMLLLKMARYVMDKRILCIAIIVLLCPLSTTFATNYYLSPSGSDGNSGLSTTQAWATLQYAKGELSNGDTLFIMGGTYSSIQYFHDITDLGWAGLTFKAYGDSVARFVKSRVTNDEDLAGYFLLYGGPDSIVIDGFSSLDPNSPGWLEFVVDATANSLIKIRGSSSDYAVNTQIKGVVFDGNSGDLHDLHRAGQGIWFAYCQNGLIEHCTIREINHPSGNISPGDGTDTSQGSGNGIQIAHCKSIIIQNNTLSECNHTAINLGAEVGDYSNDSKYIIIRNNTINQGWGGGIYLTCNAHHCLVDNNIIVNCGATTTFNKPGIQVSGSHNVIRRNVIYNPENQGIDMEAQTFVGWDYIIDSCMVYNNVVFGSGHAYSIKIFVNNNSSADCSGEHMLIANNIFYKSEGSLDVNATSEVYIPLGNTNNTHNWIEPDASSTEPASTHWGGNLFSNNCIRRNSDGASHDELIAFVMDATYGGATRRYSLDAAQGQDPIAWHGNTGIDPLIMSEDPDGYGLFEGWWHLSPNSQLINAGTWVDDAIGAYVESMSPGYGWGNLSYRGGAPDIGAHESSNEDPAPLSSPDIIIRPGEKF
jgi:hypothetical protein